MRLPGSHSSTRSIMRNGKRCGRYCSTSWMLISAMIALFAFDALFQLAHAVGQIRKMPDHRRIALPGLVLFRRNEARIGAGLADRVRDHGVCRYRDVVANRQVAEN